MYEVNLCKSGNPASTSVLRLLLALRVQSHPILLDGVTGLKPVTSGIINRFSVLSTELHTDNKRLMPLVELIYACNKFHTLKLYCISGLKKVSVL